MTAKRIALFGRPGVGTATVVANLAAALAEAGHRVAVIGCSADGRTTASLCQEKKAPLLFEVLRQTPHADLLQLAVTGFKGVICIELGKPVEDVDTSVALTIADKLLTSQFPPIDYLFYNATGSSGDPEEFVAHLIHNRQIDQLIAVSTAEVDALRSANRLLHLLRNLDQNNLVDFGGIIGNNLPAPYAEAVIDSFAGVVAVPVRAFIPQSMVVTRSAFFGTCVIDAAPLAHHAYLYRKAAHSLIAARSFPDTQLPIPLEEELFAEWSLDWGDRLYDLGEGYFGAGGGI